MSNTIICITTPRNHRLNTTSPVRFLQWMQELHFKQPPSTQANLRMSIYKFPRKKRHAFFVKYRQRILHYNNNI